MFASSSRFTAINTYSVSPFEYLYTYFILNMSKTNLLIYLPTHSLVFSISLNENPFLLVAQFKNFGMIFHSSFSPTFHIQSISKSCLLFLQNMSRIPPLLAMSTTTILICLTWTNAVPFDWFTISFLWFIIYTVTWIIHLKPNSDDITPELPSQSKTQSPCMI